MLISKVLILFNQNLILTFHLPNFDSLVFIQINQFLKFLTSDFYLTSWSAARGFTCIRINQLCSTMLSWWFRDPLWFIFIFFILSIFPCLFKWPLSFWLFQTNFFYFLNFFLESEPLSWCRFQVIAIRAVVLFLRMQSVWS